MNFVLTFLLGFNILGNFLIDQTPADQVKQVVYSWDKDQKVREIYYDYEGKLQRVIYNAYIPPHESKTTLPVLVCVGGLPIDGDQYVHSDTRECFDEHFSKFADENKIVILGVGFLFVEEDWPTKTSYQYTNVWSGKALLQILDELQKEIPIDSSQLYMFGISAGAQFSVRFAQNWPDKVKAVASHAAGGFEWPERYIPTKFLLTVGENDNEPITRREFAEYFTELGRKLGMDIELKIIPGLDHHQTEEQNEMSREFFKRVMK